MRRGCYWGENKIYNFPGLTSLLPEAKYFYRFLQGSCTNEDHTGKMERLFLSALQQREGGATGPYAVQEVVTLFVRAVAVVVCESQNPPGELHHGGSPEEI